MHYIRFLKLPKLNTPKTANKNFHELSAKITVTNDLGELFLTRCLPLEVVLLVHLNRAQKQQHIYQFEWQPYSRALDINFTILSKYLRDANGRALPCELIVKRMTKKTSRRDEGNMQDEGRIIDVYSEEFGLDSGITTTVKRILSPNHNTTMVIREGKGESIARHIWDAGLVLSELFYTMTCEDSKLANQLPRIATALSRKNLKAIELGTGVGLVGLALAETLANRENSENGSSEVLLTDLLDARELVEINIANKFKCNGHVSVDFAELDWTKPLPESIAADDWDIVIVADCIYNPDYAQALAGTIKSLLVAKGQETRAEKLAFLAMKPRHAAEAVFFDYAEQLGIRIIEKVKIPIPVLGDESQEIHILALGCDPDFPQPPSL